MFPPSLFKEYDVCKTLFKFIVILKTKLKALIILKLLKKQITPKTLLRIQLVDIKVTILEFMLRIFMARHIKKPKNLPNKP